MKELLEFTFQTLFHFVGVIILISTILDGIAKIVKALRPEKKKDVTVLCDKCSNEIEVDVWF